MSPCLSLCVCRHTEALQHAQLAALKIVTERGVNRGGPTTELLTPRSAKYAQAADAMMMEVILGSQARYAASVVSLSFDWCLCGKGRAGTVKGS